MFCLGKIRGRGVSYYESMIGETIIVLFDGEKSTRYVFLASEQVVGMATASTFLCMKLDGETDDFLDDFIFTELDEDGNHIRTF